VIREIAGAHGRTPGQVALRCLLDQPGVAAIPETATDARRVENFRIFDFALTDADRARIRALPKGERDFDPAGSRPIGTTRTHLRDVFETLSIRSRVELAGLSRSSRALH
jgi:diketogulonate reductase-like aldo/keto reductase